MLIGSACRDGAWGRCRWVSGQDDRGRPAALPAPVDEPRGDVRRAGGEEVGLGGEGSGERDERVQVVLVQGELVLPAGVGLLAQGAIDGVVVDQRLVSGPAV